MSWDTSDPMVGEKVYIQLMGGDEELATVLAVSTSTCNIRVVDADGEVLVGNQWEPAA